MPEYDQALRNLPLDVFLSAISASDEGLRISALINKLEAERGVSKQDVLRILQATLDAGTVALNQDMHVTVAKADAVAA